MGIDLSRGADDHCPRVHHEQPSQVVPRSAPLPLAVPEEELEPPLGVQLPVLGHVSDPTFQLVRYVGLGAWILLYVLWWPLGFMGMWAWVAVNAVWENEQRRRRRLRRLRKRALRQGLLTLAPVPPAPAPPAAPPPVEHPGAVQRAAQEEDRSQDPAQRALAAAVHRVDTSGRFEAADVALVHEVADLLGPLLSRTGERDGDAQVRHDLRALAGEHLPRTVEDHLALPDDYAREHRTPRGTTPAQELRSQLVLLVEGCKQLRDAVHDADVERQQRQSRFLEAKFRRGDLDL